MRHFHKHVRSSVDKKKALIYDNHGTPILIDVLDFCKENGIIMLTLPPHTSHKLQPLDMSVYKSLKYFYNQSCADWMRTDPGNFCNDSDGKL